MYTSTLRKVGGSTMLSLPPALLDILALKAGATVGISIEDGSLVINPVPGPHYMLEELLGMSTDSTQPPSRAEQEWLDSSPIGEELL
ncbi:MAG: antitoxin [Magnetococcus sp. DMHC-1]|nr:antitoxin [Magnetococcales bacterium]